MCNNHMLVKICSLAIAQSRHTLVSLKFKDYLYQCVVQRAFTCSNFKVRKFAWKNVSPALLLRWRQRGREADRQADRKTDRQTDRQTEN